MPGDTRVAASVDDPDAAWLLSEYADGCNLSESCFTCPLPACRYEMPPGRARAFMRAAALWRLLESGRTMDQVAIELGVSRRTLSRLWKMPKNQDDTRPGGRE